MKFYHFITKFVRIFKRLNSSFQYEGINHVVETPKGVYLFMTEVKAIPIPREAISEQALEFLKSKIGR